MAGGKFREITFAVDIIFAGGKLRAKSKFANIAKISSTRKIGVIQYSCETSQREDRRVRLMTIVSSVVAE